MDKTFTPADHVETDTDLMALANHLHNQTCGCDDKTCELPTEIYDWLVSGDPYGATVKELTEEVIETWGDSYDFK